MTKNNIMKLLLITLIILASSWVGCGGSDSQTADNSSANNTSIYDEPEEVDPMENIGIGPVSEIFLSDEIEQDKAERGSVIFKAKCSACHKTDTKFIGPAPKGILERRTPEWTMNMILNPDEMVQKDPIARALLMEYSAPMANQSLSLEEARDILAEMTARRRNCGILRQRLLESGTGRRHPSIDSRASRKNRGWCLCTLRCVRLF